MKSKILQEFLGTVNGVSFNDKIIYYSTQFVVEAIEDKFDVHIPDNFLKELQTTIDRTYQKSDNLSINDIEMYLYDSIQNTENLKDLQFEMDGFVPNTFLIINQGLKDKSYVFKLAEAQTNET